MSSVIIFDKMHFELFTEKSQRVLQDAQILALAKSHQYFLPEHLLKTMLEDNAVVLLINKCGGNLQNIIKDLNKGLSAIPIVEGPGAGNLHLSPLTAKMFSEAESVF